MEVVSAVLAEYRVNWEEIGPLQRGYRNRSYPVKSESGELVNLIIYKREANILARIRFANSIGEFLSLHGLPARKPLDKRIVVLSNPRGTSYAGLYNYLLGTTIPWESYTMDHIKVLGETMAIMHAALTGYRAPDQVTLPATTKDYIRTYSRMSRYFHRHNVREALQDKLGLSVLPKVFADFTKLLNRCDKLPSQQALHMDYVRGNVLFGTNPKSGELAVTGILDFEKSSCGPVVLDVARTLAFLLVDCKYKSEPQVHKYFLTSGYQKRGKGRLSKGELKLLGPLVGLFLLHDLYKFLRHNPYESLWQNEHFVSTLNLLDHRGIITFNKQMLRQT